VELRESGFAIAEKFSDVAGSLYDPDSKDLR
jgi:hypothetical protein